MSRLEAEMALSLLFWELKEGKKEVKAHVDDKDSPILRYCTKTCDSLISTNSRGGKGLKNPRSVIRNFFEL